MPTSATGIRPAPKIIALETAGMPQDDVVFPYAAREPHTTLEQPDDYRGEPRIELATTPYGLTSSEQRRAREAWVAFFEEPRPLVSVRLRGHTTQAVVDAIRAQGDLTALTIDSGPFEDLAPIAELPRLRALHIHGATRLRAATPLASLPGLRMLMLSNPHPEFDVTGLSRLELLRSLGFGNHSPGSSRSLQLPGFAWLRPLQKLERLDLAGTTYRDPDLRPLLALPRLRELNLPLRRNYRKQVWELAENNPLFAQLRERYEWLEIDRRRDRMRYGS